MNDEMAILEKALEDNSFISLVMSSPRSGEVQKVVIRPVILKEENFYQFSRWMGPQVFHENISAKQCLKHILEKIENFKQIVLFTEHADYHILISKKGKRTILKKPPSQAKNRLSLTHNRKKAYIIEEGTPVSFLTYLGVMNKEGKVYPQKSRKFKQINRFLEMIDDVLPHLNPKYPIRIIDFGCGKAYLTFALYYYLKEVKQWDIQIHGLDLKSEVIQECQKIADELNFKGITFSLGNIAEYRTDEPIDMVISLHACDTATDAALVQAIQWKAKIILCVPCCQHEFFSQIKNDLLQPLLKHGILKERFSALLTDAVRAELLESMGYQVDVIEFIDLEHTPKNLLIRGIKKAEAIQKLKTRPAYEALRASFCVQSSLERGLQDLNL